MLNIIPLGSATSAFPDGFVILPKVLSLQVLTKWQRTHRQRAGGNTNGKLLTFSKNHGAASAIRRSGVRRDTEGSPGGARRTRFSKIDFAAWLRELTPGCG